MNRTWGYTKRPRNWKERLEQFYKEIMEEEKKAPPIPERPPVVNKPVNSDNVNSPSRSRRSNTNISRSNTNIDSSFSH